MKEKNILKILLIAALLLQISFASPLPESPNADMALHKKNQGSCLQVPLFDSIESSNPRSASYELFKFTLEGFQELLLHYTKKAKTISEQLLKDDKILNSKSIKIQEFKRNLTQFEEKYSKCNGIDELLELVDLYSNTTSFYFELMESTLDEDDKLILRLLRKYGSEDLDNESLELFNVFLNKFNRKFEELREDLKKQQEKSDQKILEWERDWHEVINSKAKTNYEEKASALEKLFGIFEED